MSPFLGIGPRDRDHDRTAVPSIRIAHLGAGDPVGLQHSANGKEIIDRHRHIRDRFCAVVVDVSKDGDRLPQLGILDAEMDIVREEIDILGIIDRRVGSGGTTGRWWWGRRKGTGAAHL